MAARLNPRHDAMTRTKIKTSQLVNRLMQIAMGEVTVDQVQLRAIEIALRKTLPDLSTITLQGDEKGGPIQFAWQGEAPTLATGSPLLLDYADVATTGETEH